MKQYSFLIIVMLFFYNSIAAQSTPYRDTLPWAPEGATWVYSTSPLITIKYMHDSIISGQDVKVFKFYAQRYDYSTYPIARTYIEYAGEEYLYNSNDSIFFYDQGLEAFVLLYDFNAQEGDTWSINTSYLECSNNPSINNTPLIAIMESATTVINDNIIYYTIGTSTNNDNVYFPRTIPNIGNTSWFFPLYNRDTCNSTVAKYLNYDTGDLICYIDNIRGKLIHGSYATYDSSCTAAINMVNDYIVSVEEPTLADNKNDKFSIYPNPAHSALNVYSNGIAMQEIMIYDAVGRLVIHDKSSNQSIDINSLMSGLYIINIVDEYKQVSAFKFVKE